MNKFLIPIKLAFRNLRSNKGRTILTLVGVVIGITSVIVISASGQGMKGFVLGQFEGFGTDLIQVEPKIPSTGKASTQNAMGQASGVQITTLKIKDAEDLSSRLPNIESYAGGTIAQEVVSYQNENSRILLFGVGADYSRIDKKISLLEGNFFAQSDDDSLAQVAVIGSDVQENLFGLDSPIGKNIKINNQTYRVVGSLEKRGSVAGFNYDEIIYIPVQTVQKKILGVDYLKFITFKVKDESRIEESVADITEELRRLHDIDNPDKDDFGVTSIKEAQDTIAKVFGAINILLLALTSVSLIVGGVGIMNVMYVTVVERTFEIGLRKAVGAKSKDILRQFLFEAVFITFAGGLIGIFLGFLFSFLLSYVFSALGFDLNFIITPQALFLAVGFSVTVGMIFGYYPARSASRLSPMEALRKE